MTFKVGDRVVWSSQSAGVTKTKSGVVVLVIAPGDRPRGIRGAGSPREHESYVVSAKTENDGDKKTRGKTRRYWPLVKYLKGEPT